MTYVVIVTDPKEQEIYEFDNGKDAWRKFLEVMAAELKGEIRIEQVLIGSLMDDEKFKRDTPSGTFSTAEATRRLQWYLTVWDNMWSGHGDEPESPEQLEEWYHEITGRNPTSEETDLMTQIMMQMRRKRNIARGRAALGEDMGRVRDTLGTVEDQILLKAVDYVLRSEGFDTRVRALGSRSSNHSDYARKWVQGTGDEPLLVVDIDRLTRDLANYTITRWRQGELIGTTEYDIAKGVLLDAYLDVWDAMHMRNREDPNDPAELAARFEFSYGRNPTEAEFDLIECFYLECEPDDLYEMIDDIILEAARRIDPHVFGGQQ